MRRCSVFYINIKLTISKDRKGKMDSSAQFNPKPEPDRRLAVTSTQYQPTNLQGGFHCANKLDPLVVFRVDFEEKQRG